MAKDEDRSSTSLEGLERLAKMEKEHQNVFWEVHRSYFSDPDNHYWEVAYGPDFKLDNNDVLSGYGRKPMES